MLGSLWAFHICKENFFLQHFYLERYDPYLMVQMIIDVICDVFRVWLWDLSRHCVVHFVSNFYMICIYFILKKIKRTLLKKINILPTLPSRNHGYPVFAEIPFFKVNAYRSYENARRVSRFIYHCCGIP